MKKIQLYVLALGIGASALTGCATTQVANRPAQQTEQREYATIEGAISTEPVKEKLRNLRQYMPDQQDVVYDFGAYLADRLNPELVPQGFNMATELALYDLQKGVNGSTGQPIRSRLIGYPPVIYESLRMQVPEIAEAVCPEDFAKGVREFHEQVNAKRRE